MKCNQLKFEIAVPTFSMNRSYYMMHIFLFFMKNVKTAVSKVFMETFRS